MANNVRLFLDSNVILSGLISSQGAPRILMDLISIQVPRLTAMTGQYNYEEILRNLKRRFPQLLEIFDAYWPRMQLELIKIPSNEEVQVLTEQMSPKDAPVLAAAKLAQAHYLITGDKRGFPAAIAKPVKIISPDRFLDEKLPSIIQGDFLESS